MVERVRATGGWRRALSAGLLLLTMPLVAVASGETEEIQVEELARGQMTWDGDRLPEYPDGQPEVTILRITIPAGARLPLHHHPVINAGVLLEGELTVVRDTGEEHELAAGEAIIELVDTPHYGRNDGDRDAEIIVFYAGAADLPITVMEEAREHDGRR